MRHRSRHRWGSTALLGTTALALVVASQGAAVARPVQAAAADREFTSSFEADDPAPDWLNTVDTTPDGTKRSSGVDGGFSTGIPGNVTEHVTDVRASAENTGGGEVKENLVDVEPSTKWLTFAPTGWAEFDLDAPVKLATYALTSANDHDERDPVDWTLKGSTDGKDWKTLDSRTGESFGERFQTKSYNLAEAGRVPALPARLHQEQRRLRRPATRRRAVLDRRRRGARTQGHALPRGPRPKRLPDREGGQQASPASEPCATRAPTRRTAAPTRTTRSSTSTSASGGTPSWRTGSSRRWRTATATTPPPTRPWTWPSPTAPT